MFEFSLRENIRRFFFPDYRDLILNYLASMRCCSFYKHNTGWGDICKSVFYRLLYLKYLKIFRKLGLKLGYSLGYDSFGYGLRIPHYGTIVIGAKNRFGNYTCIHTSTCVTNTGKTIGNGCYIATGVKITTNLSLADNIKIGANSVVNKPFGEENIMIAGSPAIKKKDSPARYLDDAHKWKYEKIESLRITMGLI